MSRKRRWAVVMVGTVSGWILFHYPQVGVAGDLTVDGNLIVRTNLAVRGQLCADALALTNLSITGQATIRSAAILELVPQGDVSMGPYTNRAAGRQ